MAGKYWPLPRGYVVTDRFGWQAWRNDTHYGVDFGWPGGSGSKPVYAVQGGTVIMVGPASGFGRWVVLDHPTGDGGGTTVYGHVVPGVKLGQRVEAGQQIAIVDPNSNTNGGVAPHLHLEWHKYVWSTAQSGQRLDPLAMLDGAVFPGEEPAIPPPPALPVQWGIDVSNHQGNFDFAAAKREGFTWATHKVTEGDGYRDPYWPRAREQMREHFADRFGGYVFCKVASDPQREADLLVQHLGDTSIPVQIDYEDHERRGSIDDLMRRIDAYTSRGLRLLPIYLPRWYWRDHMGAPSLAGLPVGIWNSDYVNGTGFASALYPGNDSKGWQRFAVDAPEVVFLQFSEKGQVANQRIDVNAFRGTDADLRAVFSGTPNQESELTPEEHEWLKTIHRELTQLHPSRSLYRSTSDPIDTAAGAALNADGRAHEALVEVRALAKQVELIVQAAGLPVGSFGGTDKAA